MEHADALLLDVPRFARDLQEHRFEPRIRRDFMDGVRSGVNGTPTFFINGVRHEGGYTFDALLDAIEGGPRSYL
jgi:protein-disulfide isomerase